MVLVLQGKVAKQVGMFGIREGLAAFGRQPGSEQPQVATVIFQRVARKAILEPKRVAEFVQKIVVHRHQYAPGFS